MEALVSIVTPSYKSKRFISEAIESVIAQTYNNWEMLIVDDCSPDDSNHIIEKYCQKDSRIKLIKLKNNVGPAEARNKALMIAKGRYIAFLDSDDMWFPTKLKKQLAFMQNKNYAFTFTGYIPFSEDGSRDFVTIDVPNVINYSEYCKNTIIGCLTVIVDKEKVGYFLMPDIRSSHDMALWLLLMKRGFNAYGLSIPLSKYRLVSDSNTSGKLKAAKEVWDVYRRIEKLPLFKSSWYFINYILNAIKKRIQYT